MVMADAMVRAKSADPKVYGPELFKTDYQGVTTKVQFDDKGELKNPAYTLYVYRDGKKTPLE
jgi:branched-chain amino acid transport system substrate-binding protein